MAIGTFGTKIIFETSDQKILTFNNFQRQISNKWATHEIIGQKPHSEFLGPTLEQISFDIYLNIIFGIKPEEIIETFNQFINDGNSEFLIIGEKIIGSNPWKINSISETWNTILNHGELICASLSLNLEEYV